MQIADLMPSAIVFVLAISAGVGSYIWKPQETAAWLHNRAEYFARLWEFAGPRLTDRGFVAAIFANGAVLGFLAIDPERAQLWQFAIWAAANLVFPLWDNHPAGERVLKPRTIVVESETVSGGPVGH